MADCESELFREDSRGLNGGAFFLATLLNRKEAKTSKGKNNIDSLKDFYLLKSDARFIQYFVLKFDIDPLTDNTPDLLKSATNEEKINYLHDLVSQCLSELLPFFRESSISTDTTTQLWNHPLQKGSKISRASVPASKSTSSVPESLDLPSLVSFEVAEATAGELLTDVSKENVLLNFLETKSVEVSSTRTKQVYSCIICLFESKFKAVCLAHIENCLENLPQSEDAVTEDEGIAADGLATAEDEEETPEGEEETSEDEDETSEDENDNFFNYKNGEFFMNSIFAITTVFERYGDGVGCFIISKILLPIFHGLHHSNYTCSVHRFITRVLSEASPREALKIIHERFSNRSGRAGKNVFRDRRMEFRIGMTKKLIENLGPNFSDESVKHVNHMVDIKEELYIKTRLSHGVRIRSGRHVPRSDENDFKILVKNLTDMEAHIMKPGRKFGNFKLPENILDEKKFDKTQFYRWIALKNQDAKEVTEAKKRKA